MRGPASVRCTIVVMLLVAVIPVIGWGQTCGGAIRRGATDNFLDPDGDGDIVAGVATGFSDCSAGYVDEMGEFEDLLNPAGCASCQIPWTAINPLAEVDDDLWAGGASCTTTDLVRPSVSDGTYAYFTIVDPDGVCDNGDELLVFRVRADASVNGSFSYSLLVDSDGLLGADDPDGVQCASKIANGGFEWEIVADPANNAFVEVRAVNGVAGTYGTDAAHTNGVATAAYPNTTHYNQAFACRSECAAAPDCESDAVYHTFAVLLADMGHGCGDSLRFAGATASSGNGTLSSNTSVQDIGGAGDEPVCATDPDSAPCGCCLECASASSVFYCGGDEAVCLASCVEACVAGDTIVPVELLSLGVE